MRIAVCDDDSAFLARVTSLLESREESGATSAVASFLDGDSLIRAHSTSPFDVIFLDVVMPMVDGIEVAREIRGFDDVVKIVFLTSSREFAVESYSVKATNYLLKPIDPAALFLCLNDIERENARSARRIAVKTAHGAQSIKLNAIEHLEASKWHVKVYLEDGKIIDSTEPFNAFEEKLLQEDGFFKCHRSYIVNINHIGSYEAEYVTTRSGSSIPVSRSNRSAFKAAYFSTLFGEGDRV